MASRSSRFSLGDTPVVDPDAEGRHYVNQQTVENPGTEPEPQRGNRTRLAFNTIYAHWSAAYRGFVPHGVRLPSPEKGVIAQFDDDPATFEEAAEMPPEEDAPHVDVEPYTQVYWTSYTMNVGTTPVMIGSYNKNRKKMRLYNQGPGTVWIAHNENVANQGFPLTSVTQPLELETSREVWAVQQTAQVGFAQVSILSEEEKEIGE